MAAFRFRLSSEAARLNIADWRAAARRVLPPMAWSYVDGGADDLLTLAENESAFCQWRLRQRVLTGVSASDLSTIIAGTPVSLPVGLAPTGASGLSHWSGDVAIARAAEARGTRLVFSTAGSYLMEDVAAATAENHWFQLYPIGDRQRVGGLIDRARAAGYTALFITVDVPVLGNREGEKRWHFQMPWTVTPARALRLVPHARWIYQAVTRKRLAAVHYLEAAQASAGMTSGLADAAASSAALQRQMQGDLSWDDLTWMRDRWIGPMYVKGVMDPDDAARAVDEIGAQGVVVSNHGGRQLDRTLATIDALPAIVERIGDRAEVYLDGGVRRGTDVVTALALGARAVFIGRPYLYGLAAGGQGGVEAVIDIFRDEIARTLALMGCPSVAALDRSWLIPKPAS